MCKPGGGGAFWKVASISITVFPCCAVSDYVLMFKSRKNKHLFAGLPAKHNKYDLFINIKSTAPVKIIAILGN